MGALLGIGLMVAIPGIGASVALYPPDEHLPLPTRLALAAALGYVVAGGLAYLLALVHLLVPVAYFVLLAGVTVGFVLVAVRGRGPREAWLGLGRRMTPGALR